MKLPPGWPDRWHSASPREQHLVLAALALLLGALLWWVGLAPALATLRAAPAQHRLLDAQLQQMQQLQQQAQTLKAQPRLTLNETRRLLQASVKGLGATAQLSVMGERATVTVKGASPDAVAQWLTQVRLTARVAPNEARLVRNATGNWDGTLVLALSAR